MLYTKLNTLLKDIMGEMSGSISTIDAFKNVWSDDTQLSRDMLATLKRSVLVTSAGASTRIEGSKLTDEQVEQVMQGLDIQNFKDRDTQEVQGYYEILENVFNAFQTIPLSESSIKFLHKELLKYTDKDDTHRGEYKKKENKVAILTPDGEVGQVVFDTTPAFLVVKEMQELVEWVNNAFLEKQHHPLILIALFVVIFLKIHPFEDGNGRLSRVLTNLLLLQHGYGFVQYASHERVIEQNKPEYYIALRRVQATLTSDDVTVLPWMQFFFTIVSAQVDEVKKIVSSKKMMHTLSVNQQNVLRFIRDAKGQEISPMDIEQSLAMVRPTLNKVLKNLLNAQLIQRRGRGRATRYVAV